MLTRHLLAALLLGGFAACTPTAETAAPAGTAGTAAQAAAGPGVAECRAGMADATGQPASAMTATPAGAGKVVVQAPNGRRALCQLDAAGKLAKFDMM